MVFFCLGTKEGNWGSPLSSTSVFPVFYVCEQDTEVGNDLVAQCLRHPTYCFEHVVEHSVIEQYRENTQLKSIIEYSNTQ